jgi:seryl-tRNA synthetase
LENEIERIKREMEQYKTVQEEKILDLNNNIGKLKTEIEKVNEDQTQLKNEVEDKREQKNNQKTMLAQILFSVHDIYKKMVEEPDSKNKKKGDVLPTKPLRRLQETRTNFDDFEDRTSFAEK